MWSSSAPWATPSEVPVDPSAPEAQQWARDELARAVYDRTPSLWDRFWTWLMDRIAELLSGMPAGGSPLIPVLVVVALCVALAVAFAWNGRIQRTRAAAGSRSATLFDDARTSARLRTDSESAARAGDWAAAVLDRFRAVVRSLDERALLEDSPGMTADEAARAAGGIQPPLRREWDRGARTFDAVCYGRYAATPADYRAMCDLDAASARPATLATT